VCVSKKERDRETERERERERERCVCVCVYVIVCLSEKERFRQGRVSNRLICKAGILRRKKKYKLVIAKKEIKLFFDENLNLTYLL